MVKQNKKECKTKRNSNMSLNDVYSIKYTPDPRSEALEYIDSVLREAEEKMRKHMGNVDRIVGVWKGILEAVKNGRMSEDDANSTLQRKQLPLLEDDYEPSEDNFVRWRVGSVKLNLDYNLLSAIRDACA